MAFMPTVVHAQDVQEPPAPWDGSVSPFLNFDMNDNLVLNREAFREAGKTAISFFKLFCEVRNKIF